MDTEGSARPVKQKRATSHKYTTEEKLRAITIAKTINPDHPLSQQGIAEIRQTLNAPNLSMNTLQLWMRELGTQVRIDRPTAEQTIRETHASIVEKFSSVRRKALEVLDDTALLQTGRVNEIMMVAGTAHDKLERMEGLPPERLSRIRRITEFCLGLGLDTDAILDEVYTALQLRYAPQEYKQIDMTGSTEPTKDENVR